MVSCCNVLTVLYFVLYRVVLPTHFGRSQRIEDNWNNSCTFVQCSHLALAAPVERARERRWKEGKHNLITQPPS